MLQSGCRPMFSAYSFSRLLEWRYVFHTFCTIINDKKINTNKLLQLHFFNSLLYITAMLYFVNYAATSKLRIALHCTVLPPGSFNFYCQSFLSIIIFLNFVILTTTVRNIVTNKIPRSQHLTGYGRDVETIYHIPITLRQRLFILTIRKITFGIPHNNKTQ